MLSLSGLLVLYNTAMVIQMKAANVFDKSVVLHKSYNTPETLALAYDAAIAFVPELAEAPAFHAFQRERVVTVASDLFLRMEAHVD